MTHTETGNFAHSFIDSHGYSPTQLYCQMTGKPIGTLDSEEVAALIRDIGGDRDSLCDEYAVRLLASCRPSIRWNKMREETIDQMRTRAPVETLAYLLNRLIATPESKRQTFEDRLADLADRIRRWDYLTLLDSDTVTRCLNMLIEMDACTGLDSIVCDLDRIGFNESDLAVVYRAEMKLHAQRVKHAKEQNNWMAAGSPLSRQAYANVVRENAPPTKTAIAQSEKRAESKFFNDLFNELSAASTESTPAHAAKVVLPTVRLGTLKLNIARKA